MALNEMNLNSVKMVPSKGEFRRFIRVFLGRKVVLFGLIIIIILIILAIFAPLIAPYNPYKMDLTHPLIQPNSHHLLGTDALGRDTLSRIIYGTRTSLLIGIVATAVAAVVGMGLGLIAGYWGGFTFAVIMRFTDALMSFPPLLLAVVLAALLGVGLKNVVIAISISMMPIYIRLMCAQTMSVKENEYVVAARSSGASNLRIMFREVLPNCLSPLIVAITLQIGLAILTEAALSYLGIGIQPPGAAWGYMVADGYPYLVKLPISLLRPRCRDYAHGTGL